MLVVGVQQAAAQGPSFAAFIVGVSVASHGPIHSADRPEPVSTHTVAGDVVA
jgi:hypothetical protein